MTLDELLAQLQLPDQSQSLQEKTDEQSDLAERRRDLWWDFIGRPWDRGK